MTRIFTLPLAILLLTIQSCNSIDCYSLPHSYSSYNEAIEAIEDSHFHFEESVNTSKSTWIVGASFYSCDKENGYFILETKNKKYLYSGMPTQIWIEFKNSESFGKYYNSQIKGRYTFHLKNQYSSD